MNDWSDIPKSDRDQIRQRLIQHIMSMDDIELSIHKKSDASFSKYVAIVAQSIAELFGYLIAVPIALGISIVKGGAVGFWKGVDAAFD